jgi:predicted RNase H-like HicB family nuclease
VSPPFQGGEIRRLLVRLVSAYNRRNPLEEPWNEAMKFSIEYEQEEDGRWLAEVPQLPGVLAYGATLEEALTKTEALALRVLAEQLEQGESRPQPISISVAAA